MFEAPKGLGEINVNSGSTHSLRSQATIQVVLTEMQILGLHHLNDSVVVNNGIEIAGFMQQVVVWGSLSQHEHCRGQSFNSHEAKNTFTIVNIKPFGDIVH